MNLIIKNTSRYPDAQVKRLVGYAARYVRSEAVRCGWVEKFDRYPLQMAVTNTSASYCGRSLGVRRFDKNGNTPGRQNYTMWTHPVERRCFLVRVGSPEKFPTNSKYARYNRDDMPDAALNDWQEAVVGLTAHELTHTHYNYATGDRKGDEISCELTEIDCVAQFRKERSMFDEFVLAEKRRGLEQLLALAAKRSPEAVAAKNFKDAEVKLARWTRRQKLATTKVKNYTRAAKRAARRVAELETGHREVQS